MIHHSVCNETWADELIKGKYFKNNNYVHLEFRNSYIELFFWLVYWKMPNLRKISLGRYSYTFSSSKKSDSDRNVKFLALTYIFV